MAKIPSEPQVQVNFRMPVSLRQRVQESAEINGRSMTAEIVQLLEKALGPDSVDGAMLRDEFYAEFGAFLEERRNKAKDD